MKVTNNNNNSVGTQAKVETGKTSRSDSTRNVGASKSKRGLESGDSVKDGSKVDVSQRAQMMQKAKGLAANDSVDEAKVARLQKLIDEGKYQVDADKVADRLVDEHLLMPE